MSLQTAALEYAINHFDDIWEQFEKETKKDKKNYIAAILTWETDRFKLTFDIDNDVIWEYEKRERLMLFSYTHDNLPPADEALMYLKNQLKDLQRVEQEIATSSKTVVVTYHYKGHTYTADTLLDAPWCPFYMKFRTDIPSIDDAIARMKYGHNIGPITKTLNVVTKTDTALDFDKYDFEFSDNAYLINHYQDLQIENKLTLIQFLENMAELKGYYPYNINYGADTDDLLYNLYNRRGLAIIDAVVKNLTKSPEDLVTPYVALNEMSDISKAYQSIKNTNKDASEPLQDIFDSLNNLIADSPVGQIDNQDAIDKLAQTFTVNLTKKA